MAQRKIDIVNLALRELGHTPIESFDENDDAETADGLYDLERDSLLLSNRWSWLERRDRLTQTPLASPPGEPFTYDSGNPANDPDVPSTWTGESAARAVRRQPYLYEYRTPSLTAVVSAIYRSERADTPDAAQWTRRGELIFSDSPQLFAVYQELSSEPTFHRLFVNALELAVAARLAIPLTEDAEIEARLSARATRALRDAKRVDAQSQPVKRISTFPYVRARVGGDRLRYGYGTGGP